MNKENDIEVDGPRDERHELLCAYVLGETTPAEAARVEAWLAEDAELRAERARIEGAIGLVRTELGGAAALSEAVRASVEAAAAAGPQPAGRVLGGAHWFQRPGVRAAAGFAAAVGLVGAFAASHMGGPDGGWTGDDVARAPEPTPRSRGDLAAASAVATSAPRAGRDGLAVRLDDGRVVRLDANELAAAETRSQLSKLSALGYNGGGGRILTLEEARREVAEAKVDGRASSEGVYIARTGDAPSVSTIDLRGYAGTASDESPAGKEDVASLGLDSPGAGIGRGAQRGRPGSNHPNNPGPTLQGELRVGRAESESGDATPRTQLEAIVYLGHTPPSEPPGPAVQTEGLRELGYTRSGSDPAASGELGSDLRTQLEQLGYVADGGGYRGQGDTAPPGGGGGTSPGTPPSGLLTQEQNAFFHARRAGEPTGEAWAGPPQTGSSDFFLGGAVDSPADGYLYFVPRDEADGEAGGDATSPVGRFEADADAFGLSPQPIFAEDLVERRRQLLEALVAVEQRDDADAPFGAFALELARNPNRYGDFLRAEAELKHRLGLDERQLLELLQALGYLELGYGGSADQPEALAARTRLVASELAKLEAERLLGTCRRLPGESLKDMYFRHWGTRPFTRTVDDALSTFAADVDTASYTLARGMLNAGFLPRREQVRVEEFVNYFDAELAPPVEGTFAITTELGPSLFRPQGSQHWMLRVGVKAKEVAEHERRAVALTFVIDVSGSMKQGGRLDLVKNALSQLLSRLEPTDSVAIVKFSNSASLVLPRTSAGQRSVIEAAIAGLGSGGGTNAEGGLVLGFDAASRAFDPEAGNRVVFLSDGVGNIGETDQERILARVAGERAKGIYLNTVGVGLGNHNDAFLEQLANRGDGLTNYVDGPLEARRALVDNFLGAFETIARDVKLQVEFDAEQVGSWRLLGYENRAIADREFRNDAVDAGEVGSGHSVVALYELADVTFGEGDLATVRVRFKAPFDGSTPEGATSETAAEIAAGADASRAVVDFGALSQGFRKAALAAQAAEVLRRSGHAGGDSVELLVAECERLANQASDLDFREFAGLVARNRGALTALVQPQNEVDAAVDELKYLRYELEREREAEGEPDAQVIEGLEARIRELEDRVRRCVFPVAAVERR